MSAPEATRNSFQIGRRLFHMIMGLGVGTLYMLFLDRGSIVTILGLAATLLYVFEQVRTNYPEHAAKLKIINKYLLRAEEQLEESAAVPYAMAILLTILTFSKPVAIAAIYTLAVADPMSAIIGIKFGKRKIGRSKSLEGSAAFFISTFVCTIAVLLFHFPGIEWRVWVLAVVHSLVVTGFELIPLRIDDNLTIPLFSAISLWFFSLLFSLSLINL